MQVKNVIGKYNQPHLDKCTINKTTCGLFDKFSQHLFVICIIHKQTGTCHFLHKKWWDKSQSQTNNKWQKRPAVKMLSVFSARVGQCPYYENGTEKCHLLRNTSK